MIAVSMFCLSPFCYVCLRNKEELFNLNNVDGDLMRLWDKLLYCMAEIEVMYDDIPLFICRECRRDLRAAYTFRKKFLTNFPYVDDYIKQLTYVGGLLVAEEDEVEVTEHADLCVTLVDFAKRFQHSSSNIKIETSDEDSNSVDDSQVEIQAEQTDMDNIPLSLLYKRENQSTELKENSNEPEKLCSNWETLKSSIENPTNRRKLDDDVSITDIQDDGNEVIMSLEDRVSNSVDVKDDNSSLEEINIVCNKHDHNYNDLDDIFSNTEVQKVSETIQAEPEMPAEVSTLLTRQENPNVDVSNEELDYISVERNEESNKDSGQSSSTEPIEAETNIEPSTGDMTTSAANTLTLQQSAEESSPREHSSADVQAIRDHIPVCSNKNKEENVTNQVKTNIESSSAIDAGTDKENTSKQQLDTPVHPGNGKLNQQGNSVKQIKVTQPAKSKVIRPDDSVTNALFKSIRNSDKTYADVDDGSSRPSVATSMYESDVIDLSLSENSDEYISDNDDGFGGCRQPDTSVNRCNVSGTCRRDYADISSPNHTADVVDENTSANGEIHRSRSESGRAESASTSTLVRIKRPMSDVEDNYSNETVLYDDGVQPNTADTVISSFSFMKAYLECTEANVPTDMNTAGTNGNSEPVTMDASTNSTDECNQKNNQSGKHPSSDQTTSSSTENKSASAECKKSVYTSIRKKIPRLIDLNGGIRKNVTSTFEHFTTWNNKRSLISHAQQTRQLVDCQTSNSTNVQQEIYKDPSDTTSDSNNILTRSTSETSSNDIAVYNCTNCNATFKYQSLLDCHVEEKHTRRLELLPDISVQDEHQVVRSNSLATYRIPHKNKSLGNGENRLDNTTISTTRVDDAIDKSQRGISTSENVEQTVLNKHSVDVATNPTNVLCINDKPSTSANTKVLLHKQSTDQLVLAKQPTNINSTISCQGKPNAKREKSLLTKHTHQTKNNVTKSQRKHHHLSASSHSKKCTTPSKRHVMIDKAIGTIDFTDNSTGIYSFTDAIEENMYRIHAGENTAHNHHNQKPRTDQQVEKVSAKVKTTAKAHKQPDIVHYYRTTEHLTLGKHERKPCKKHTVQASSTRKVQKVDKSTETTALPTNQVAVKKVVNKSVSSSSEQPNNTHKNGNTDKESTKCSLCDSTFADLNSLREHLIIQHKTYKKFQCTLCEKYFRQRCRLLYHMVNSHATAQLHVCSLCHKNFSSSSTLKRHARTHASDKPYKCPVCDKAFRYKESVKTHMVLHTGVKAFRCPYCERTFAFKGNMLQHVQTHTKDKRYPCPLCDKDFCTNTVMKQHMRTHTGERPYKCPTCGRAFTVRQTMVLHMSVHTDVKPYPCTMCPARFKLKQHLRRHMFVHTEDRPYKCAVCDKAFRLKTELNKHASIHDDTKQPYTCDTCNVGYSRRDKLYAHNFNVHYKKDINLVTLSKEST